MTNLRKVVAASIAAPILLAISTSLYSKPAAQSGMARYYAALAKKEAALNSSVNKQFSPVEQRHLFVLAVDADRSGDAVASKEVPRINGFADNKMRATIRARAILEADRVILAKNHMTLDQLRLIESRGYTAGWPLPPVVAAAPRSHQVAAR